MLFVLTSDTVDDYVKQGSHQYHSEGIISGLLQSNSAPVNRVFGWFG